MKKQAVAPKVKKIMQEDFFDNGKTIVFWLGGAGALINSHGTTIMIDPIISHDSSDILISEVFGCKLFFQEPPILSTQIKTLNAVLFTHADEDHMGSITPRMLLRTQASFHGTRFVGRELMKQKIPYSRIVTHQAMECFYINDIRIEITPALHPWQESRPDLFDWKYSIDDCCGYRIITRDGIIWHPGDSQLLAQHFNNTDADLVFIDFSEDFYHFGSKNAIRLANHLHQANLIMYHWGTYDDPNDMCSNANPSDFKNQINNPERLFILAPGEPFILKKKSNL